MFTDPIADYLTRIRNANSAGHRVVDIPASNTKREITKILFDQGYILSYKFEETENHQGNIKIALKYDKLTKEPVIKKLQRISTPGLRKYSWFRQSSKGLEWLRDFHCLYLSWSNDRKTSYQRKCWWRINLLRTLTETV